MLRAYDGQCDRSVCCKVVDVMTSYELDMSDALLEDLHRKAAVTSFESFPNVGRWGRSEPIGSTTRRSCLGGCLLTVLYRNISSVSQHHLSHDILNTEYGYMSFTKDNLIQDIMASPSLTWWLVGLASQPANGPPVLTIKAVSLIPPVRWQGHQFQLLLVRAIDMFAPWSS